MSTRKTNNKYEYIMNQSGSFVNKAGHEIEITDENLESLMEEEG